MYDSYNYYVYIVRCCDGSYYTGVTNNYHRRVAEHQDGKNPKCYTFKRHPLELVYVAHFENIHDAISWEKVLKKWRREKKEAVIARRFGDLPRLSLSKTPTEKLLRKIEMHETTACHPELVEGRHAVPEEESPERHGSTSSP